MKQRVNRLEVVVESPPETRLEGRMNLTLRPAWRTSARDATGTLAIHYAVSLATMSSGPMSWREHLQGHLAMRELLSLSAWQDFAFNRLSVNRVDDPERVLSGDAIEPRWAEVATHRGSTTLSGATRFMLPARAVG
jgi:hypothetical protein